MTTIWNVEPDEIPEAFLPGYRKGLKSSAEGNAIRALQEGKTIAFPCRWQHTEQKNRKLKNGKWSYHRVCMGANFAHVTANRHGFRIKSTCKDKIVYVQYKDDNVGVAIQ